MTVSRFLDRVRAFGQSLKTEAVETFWELWNKGFC